MQFLRSLTNHQRHPKFVLPFVTGHDSYSCLNLNNVIGNRKTMFNVNCYCYLHGTVNHHLQVSLFSKLFTKLFLLSTSWTILPSPWKDILNKESCKELIASFRYFNIKPLKLNICTHLYINLKRSKVVFTHHVLMVFRPSWPTFLLTSGSSVVRVVSSKLITDMKEII